MTSLKWVQGMASGLIGLQSKAALKEYTFQSGFSGNCAICEGIPLTHCDDDGNILEIKKGEKLVLDFGKIHPMSVLFINFPQELLDAASIKGNVVFPKGEESLMKFTFTFNKGVRIQDIPYWFRVIRTS